MPCRRGSPEAGVERQRHVRRAQARTDGARRQRWLAANLTLLLLPPS